MINLKVDNQFYEMSTNLLVLRFKLQKQKIMIYEYILINFVCNYFDRQLLIVTVILVSFRN